MPVTTSVSEAAPQPGRDHTRADSRQGRLPYLPGLDGVRAVAIAAVLLFHLPARVLPGGFLGVDLFFVLSGFLITSLLLEEVSRNRTVDFGQFYLRRARRLLPALGVTLVLSSVLVLTVARDAAAQFRQDAVAALTYTTNWWYVLDDRSYFEVMGRPPLLQHLWSLAVEEQFYLVWPVLAFLAWRRWGRTGVAAVAVVGAVASTAWMGWLSIATGVPAVADAARVYFGSDSHAMTLMVGAALAVVWRPARLPDTLPLRGQLTLAAAAAASLAGLVGFFVFVNEQSGWLYRGGFLLMAATALPLLVATSHPASVVGRALGTPALRWLGTRSYGIYLFHWPVFLVTRPDLDLPYGGVAAAGTSLALTGVIAELSYRFVEMPVRHGALGRLWTRFRASTGRARGGYVAALVGIASVVVASSAALVSIPSVDAASYLGGVTAVGAGALPTDGARDGQADRSGSPPTAPHGKGTPGKGPDRPVDLTTQRITAVGDSVLLGARDAVQKALPRVTIDASVSRQPSDLIDRIEERRRAGALADVLVIHTGTNGLPVTPDLRALLMQLDDLTRIVLVNVRSPVPWAAQSNEILQVASRELDNVVIADWAAASSGRRDYFESDGTHLTPKGAAAFAQTIVDALREPLPNQQ